MTDEERKKKVIAGNFCFYPETLLRFLRKSCYIATYDERREVFVLDANHNDGGARLLEIRDIDYAGASRIAKELGLKQEDPSRWAKRLPVLHLDHDGSEEAEKLRLEMLRLDVPHTVYKKARTLRLVVYPKTYTAKDPLEKMLEAIREAAKNC